jgi:3-oxoacyl-(acyl-carrier-protein) synthase
VESARAAGVAPLATLAGYASTCEAFHRVRIKEDGDEPARAITLALAEAGLRPEELGHISAHGTGTELGDRLETRALKLALGDAAKNIPVSAPKSMLGHPQGASAAQGLAAVLAAFEADAIPPTINLEIPDPRAISTTSPARPAPAPATRPRQLHRLRFEKQRDDCEEVEGIEDAGSALTPRPFRGRGRGEGAVYWAGF